MATTPQREQGVTITLAIDAESVTVAFIDRGVGLAEDAEEHLFQPFYTTKSNGTGIGLSVCDSIIQQHGGRIGFERNTEIGATFYFTLPRHHTSATKG